MQNIKEEEKRIFVRYYTSQGTEEEFLTTSTLKMAKQS